MTKGADLSASTRSAWLKIGDELVAKKATQLTRINDCSVYYLLSAALVVWKLGQCGGDRGRDGSIQ
jgi:hypothetical protein